MASARRIRLGLVCGMAALAAGCATRGAPAPVTIAGADAPAAVAGGRVPGVVADGATPDIRDAEAAPSLAGSRGDFSAYLGRLRAASCPGGASDAAGEVIALSARPITLGRLGMRRETAGRLSYVGGFHLESGDARFGGLSGLDVLPDGGLLSISDQGDFVWIDLDSDGLTPVSARIASMRDEQGSVLRGKAEGDAEGLAYHDGLALVSFERDHRILASDIGACGADARGAAIVREGMGGAMSEAFSAAGLGVTSNGGPEPLGVTDDWYVFVGTETLAEGRGPLSARPIEAAPRFDLRVEEGAPAFVGVDLLDESDVVRAFSLHRGFDSLTGNAIVISETVYERRLNQRGLPARIISEINERSQYEYHATSSRRLAELGAAINNVDNFEGIAVKRIDAQRVRIFIVSDDNFSDRQRTLLMAFDLTG